MSMLLNSKKKIINTVKPACHVFIYNKFSKDEIKKHSFSQRSYEHLQLKNYFKMEVIYSMRRKPLKCEPPHMDRLVVCCEQIYALLNQVFE